MAKMIRLMPAKVGHRRLLPKKHQFLYRVFYVKVPITAEILLTPRFFSFDKWNVLSVRTTDYTKVKGITMRSYITKQCKIMGLTISADWDVELVTHPRLFGYAFNPISYWLVRDPQKKLIAVLCAVNNTFKQSHNYFVAHDDFRPISNRDTLTSKKDLYVSPFNDTEGYYQFRFVDLPGNFESYIDLYNRDSEKKLETFVHGTDMPLTNATILRAVVSYPFMTIGVVARIHLNALRLLIKGMRYTMKQSLKKDYKNNRTSRSRDG